MNRAWDRWLDPAAKPARMTIEARLVDPRWRVEITAVAALP
jgi:enamine deaminase RidA (YjgF/YER057c/UK114 family)